MEVSAQKTAILEDPMPGIKKNSRSKSFSVQADESLDCVKRRRAATMSDRTQGLRNLFKRGAIRKGSSFYQSISTEKNTASQSGFGSILEDVAFEWESKEDAILTPNSFIQVAKAAFKMTQILLIELIMEFRKTRRNTLEAPKKYLEAYAEYQETKSSISEIVVQEIAKVKKVEAEVIDKNVSFYLESGKIAQLGEEGKALMKEFEEKLNPLPESKKKVTEATYGDILDYQLELSTKTEMFAGLFEIAGNEDIVSDLILLKVEDLIHKKFGVEEEDCLEYAYQAMTGMNPDFQNKTDEILMNFENLVEALNSRS